MSKILFTHSYFYRFDEKQWKAQQPYPPYGTLYAAANMRARGFEVSLFDTNLINNPDEILPLLEKQRPQYLVVYDDGFNYLTKMCLTRMREAAFKLIHYGKKYGCTVIVNSSDSTDHYEQYLNKGADFIIQGEGEVTLQELVESIEKNTENYTNIPGIVFSHNQKIIRNPARPVLRNLDTLPDPAWDLVDMHAYKSIWLNNHGYFSLNIATTRGCPFKCNWCAKPIYGNRYNSRSPERVAAEMEMLIRQHGAQHFWMCDDIFGLKPGWVQSFRDIVVEKKLNLRYKIQSRADLLLKEDTIDALAESGLQTVWIGAESGSQKILDAMDKGTTVEQIYQATRLLKKKKIKVGFFLQFGYLDENQDDIQKTIQMVLELMPDEIGVSVSYPLPGTKFFEKVKSQLKEKQNWTDSDDLAMMYKATYSPNYYRRLHRYIHKVFRRKQGFQTLKDIIRNPLHANRQKLRASILTLYYTPAALIDNFRLKILKS